ncbi:MAG TPA: HAMP domain-containing sensor histidine kinase [Gaiellaceae bacterium]|jgi:two-component system sensor histidine kinase MprB|nr:HAMP domain-containing sensor histidine kinase [Gaiellaceae bacterium]
MTLRTRLTLAGGGAVLVALTVAALVIFFSVRSNLHDQIDVSLIQSAQNVATKTLGATLPAGKLPAGGYAKGNPHAPTGPLLGTEASGYFQIIPSLTRANHQAVAISPGNPKAGVTLPALNSFVPLTKSDTLVASGTASPYFHDVDFRGTPLRVYTTRLGSTGDGLVRTARPLTEANSTLRRVEWLLVALTIGGAAAAALLGRLAAGAVLQPVRALANAASDVTATRDLKRRIPVDGHDEIASLAGNFNAMLSALDESQQAQQQLIADASHELRTPLTAHRANVELLARPDLPPERRPSALNAALRGIEELSQLVGDLIEAARDGRSIDTRSTVALDEVVAGAVERARLRAPALRFELRVEPYAVPGARARIERAIDNVLDNAVKWSPAGGTIDVELMFGNVTVRDAGRGIDPADLPHVFDRFYRAADARGFPGSGLGLAIVKQTVDDHGGSAQIVSDGRGTVVALRFDHP